ncbi:lysophospholipid acyltransferase family protein [Allostreptomyces psammosilenae]|uniref:1-acyl-sn-glycerol-3-phosphate acyltransferase n=1 Tax=Allostreptomyces psammosilenae TaxID=1892865 RepID=A0A852ZT64_9ACTN|nr:lysophospholipid acyltransferase family protein [Allostreptomyces psammosilenae]NYI04460.1 1-acyl-sn-glycerol-3-phosphate acyltransferase [Allostreptomyces psammosilenae]
MVYHVLKYLLFAPVLRLLFRLRVSGREHIPARGPAILAGNHLSFLDHFLMPVTVRRRVTFLAKAEYFTGRGVRGRLTAAFFRGVGQIPVDRSGGAAAAAALAAGTGVLEAGDLLGIYPEGTRSHDGRLYRGRTGVAKLALTTGAPVVPCAMVGTFELQPTGQRLPRLGRVQVRFGPPLDFSDLRDRSDDGKVLREVTDRIMAAIAELSGQEYVDRYATAARAIQARHAAAERDLAAHSGGGPGAGETGGRGEDAAGREPGGPGAGAGPDTPAAS